MACCPCSKHATCIRASVLISESSPRSHSVHIAKRRSPAAQDIVELLFEVRIATAEPGDDFLGPIQIFALALQGPVERLSGGDVAHVASFVGQLDLFGSGREVR